MFLLLGQSIKWLILVLKLSEFTKYPISIYPKVLRIVFIFLVPYAFVSFYPATFLLGKGNFPLFAFLGPVVSIAFLVRSVRIFSFGISRYESSGN
jgi:ABC-type uncharacterized transport system, permease component